MRTTGLIIICLLLYGQQNANGNGPGAAQTKSPQIYLFQYENVLGTSMELKISTYERIYADHAEKAVLDEINRLSKILSAYDAESEFSKWLKTSGQQVRLSPELFEVMQLFDSWRLRTFGALDASAEVVINLWKQAATEKRLPTQQELYDAVAEVKQRHWVLDPATGCATHVDHAPLILNTFVKSYIINRAVETALKLANIKAIVLNIGGDMVIAGNAEESVLVSDPKADAENDAPLYRLHIRDMAVATSGNYRRGEFINGRWYSHIVDPRTGEPAEGIISATVVAPVATDAGALATAFNVMTIDQSIQLASTIPGVEYLIIDSKGKRVQSKGWSKLELPIHEKKGGAGNQLGEKNGGFWNKDFEMIINLEINTQKQGFAKRPYVAVWIEDTSHYPVRTIAVWHGSDRYMPELKSWYLKYRNSYSADMNFKNSITSATRPAGKYTLKWDGKDDKGNDLKPGKYVVKIEVSREHGTYQLIRQEVVCDGTPKQIDLPANIEIASASIDYRIKSGSN